MVGIVAAVSASTSSSSTTVAIVAIVAGAAVGVVAPVVAGYFQRRNTGLTIDAEEAREANALEAERERLAATLEAEDRRLQDRLSFERGETDRAEVRGILDALAESLYTIDSLVDQINTLTLLDELAQNRGETPRACSEYDKVREPLQDEEMAVVRQIERLRNRLGSDGSELVDVAHEIRRRAGNVRLASIGIDLPALMKEEPGDLREDAREVRRLRGVFVEKAHRFTGARLHIPPGRQTQSHS